MTDQTDWLSIRLRLYGFDQVRRETAATAGEIAAMGDATKVAGEKSAFAAEKNFLLGESLYSLRRYAFWGITSIGLTAGAVVKMGYDFIKTKTEAVDSLTAITGGLGNARTEVNALIGLTHNTGLGLDVLATAAKNMLTFGYSVRETNTYLKDFGNYAQAKGLGSAGLTDIVSVFDRIKDTGRLDSRSLKALEGLGIPGKALAQTLGLSPDQLTLLQRGQGFVSASAAEPALASWMSRYAASQPKGISQQFGIAKSYLAPLLGQLTQPFFDWLDTTALPGLTKRLKAAVAGLQSGGIQGMFTALDPSGTLTNAWLTLSGAIRIVAETLRNLWAVVKPIAGAFLLVTSAVLSLTGQSRVLKALLEPLIALYIVHRTYLLLNTAATWALTTATAALRFGLASLRLVIVVLRAAWMLLDAAMFANPIGLIVLGVAALAVGFYLAYTRVKGFRDFINAYWPALTAIIAPFIFPLVLIAEHIQTIWNLLKTLYNWVDTHVFNVKIHVPGQGILSAVEHPIRTVESAAHAASSGVGGVVLSDTSIGKLAAALDAINQKRPVELHADGKKIAEVVSAGKAARVATT